MAAQSPMHSKRSHLLLSFIASGALGCASLANAPDAKQTVLPLRTLRLYETGVGYFERTGSVDADSSVVLPVPTGHLDDALKTLVVVGSSTVHGVEFNSSLSKGLARRLSGLPSGDEAISYLALLASLKGARIEVRLAADAPGGGRTFEARLIEVLEPTAEEKEAARPRPPKDGEDTSEIGPQQLPDLTLLVAGSDGELSRINARHVIAVRPLDAQFPERMGATLDTLGRGAQSRRTLQLITSGSKPVTLGYLAEAPLWRTTYRLILDDKAERATLQGWALLHNDTEENWAGVAVELVNGRPDSFLYPLAAPRYGRRPLAEPEEPLSTVPQLLDTSPDQMWGDHDDETIGHGSGTGTGYGSGSGHGRLGGSHASRAPQVRMGATVTSSEALRIGNLAEIVSAEGTESGALFSYRLAKPINLRAHGSTLVPFLSASVVARRITWFSKPGETGRSALRFLNATRQTLPAGPIAIYEGGGFGGEAGLERLKPKERAFVQFGVDMDVELELVDAKADDEPRRLSFEKRTLVQDFVRRHVRSYSVKNRSGQSRVVYLELDIVTNSKVEGADELDFDAISGRPLALFKSAPTEKKPRRLEIIEGLRSSTRMDSLTPQQLETIAATPLVPAADRALALAAAKHLHTAQDRAKEQAETNEAITEVNADLERLRKHLEALGEKTAAGANPIVTRILAAEDRLTALRQKLKTLQEAQQAARKDAETVLEKLEKPTTPPPVTG